MKTLFLDISYSHHFAVLYALEHIYTFKNGAREKLHNKSKFHNCKALAHFEYVLRGVCVRNASKPQTNSTLFHIGSAAVNSYAQMLALHRQQTCLRVG